MDGDGPRPSRLLAALALVALALAVLPAHGAEHGSVARHAIKLHRGREAAARAVRSGGGANGGIKQWACGRLATLLKHKAQVIRKLNSAIGVVEKDGKISPEEKLFQVHTLEIFQRELNDSESSVFQAIVGLQRALQGDFRDLLNMKESSRQRLEALRQAAIKEEQEYVELVAAERREAEALKVRALRNRSLSMLDGVLEDVRRAANRLEERIEEHVFDNQEMGKGANVEAVWRLEEPDEDSVGNMSRREAGGEDLGLSMLIDSLNNQYVLTKPRDSTIPRSDHHLITDIVAIVLLSLPCGWLCMLMGLPSMFGYVVCGVLLGPSGLNAIKAIVQVETLGEFGVFFTLFFVGLEFYPDRLRKVWRVALQTPLAMMVLMLGTGLLWGHVLHIPPNQSLFISACLSLSSTPLISKFLQAAGARPDKEGDGDYSSMLLGILVVQDMQLSVIIALMPTLAQAGTAHPASALWEWVRVSGLVGRVLASMAGVLLLCVLLRSRVIGPFYRRLHSASARAGSPELLTLGLSAFIFAMLRVTEALEVSMELGCFLSGVLVSSLGHVVTEEVSSCLEPIRDFLAILFFASIGLHVFPTFVLYEFSTLLFLTLFVVFVKFAFASAVLWVVLPRGSRYLCWVVASGLAQVSEFSFVLGSRARRAGIVSREVYLLILSVTTLSLLLAPALWRLSLARCLPPTADRRVAA
ncbi:transmembrane and coiled-coil domain-containing protein 3 [Lethenteron reissneri]|uniref:transmembrane and coiled-coil domain-containing protein 3 n=1 Tax=Lethenteron reissneri TaxID=7753 RepID=UPI002AB64674|nr:transmembrane and coiled-coil domain-containing protein 3 [Lethenteron reissneri]XP_061426201.1 transmembrane and coiled-coil domain-containing protein 3 [Lethenteron reissneri]